MLLWYLETAAVIWACFWGPSLEVQPLPAQHSPHSQDQVQPQQGLSQPKHKPTLVCGSAQVLTAAVAVRAWGALYTLYFPLCLGNVGKLRMPEHYKGGKVNYYQQF